MPTDTAGRNKISLLLQTEGNCAGVCCLNLPSQSNGYYLSGLARVFLI